MKKNLWTVLAGLGGAILTAIVAKLTTACPDLFANFGAVLTAGIGGAWAFLRSRESWSMSLILAAGAAGIAAMSVQVRLMCGPDFWTVAPTIIMAGVWVGIMAWLKGPQA